MSRIRVVQTRFIGRFKNPDTATPTRIFIGTDSQTGAGLRFWYDGRGSRHFIKNADFRAWDGVKD